MPLDPILSGMLPWKKLLPRSRVSRSGNTFMLLAFCNLRHTALAHCSSELLKNLNNKSQRPSQSLHKPK